MTRFSRIAGVAITLALVALAFSTASAIPSHGHLELLPLAFMGATGALGLEPPVDVATLERMRSAPAGGYEVYEDFLYDTATYVAAGPAAGAQLAFFQTQSADLTITNLNPPGIIPIGQYFHAKKLFVTPRAEPSMTAAATAAGRAADWDKIQNTARAFLNFSYQSGTKRRPSIPLEALGGLGGSIPFMTGTFAAPANVQQLRNHSHGGFPLDLILRGGEAFNFNLFVGAQTAISADLPLTLWWYGYRYVPAGRTG